MPAQAIASHAPFRRASRLAAPVLASALSVLAALAIAGCAKGGKKATFGSGEDLFGYGEYSARTLNASGHMLRLKLNQNGTYIRKKFQGACQVSESKGEWTGNNEILVFRLQEIRQRPNCETEQWTVEKASKVTERNVRNITPNSFELLDQEESSEAEWVKFAKP